MNEKSRKVAMEKSEGQAAEWVQDLMRDFQNKLTCGLYDGIYELDGAPLDTLMDAQARSCVTAFVDMTSMTEPMDIDSFLERMRSSGPSQLDVQREGDVIHWTELHRGECVCPLIRLEVIRLDPKLCICGALWVKHLFRRVTGAEVEIETLETAATGSQNCAFRITLQGGGSEKSAE
jgi:hypothetical protein